MNINILKTAISPRCVTTAFLVSTLVLSINSASAQGKLLPSAFSTVPDKAIVVYQNLLPNKFSRFEAPLYTGARTISVRVRDLELDQNSRLNNAPARNKLRVELEYKRANEQWSAGRRLIPSSSLLANQQGVILKAVLPQSNFLNPLSTPLTPRPLNSKYSSRPTKFSAADRVDYRWRIRNSSNTITYTFNARQFQMPRPFSVAIMGDSFGAGEGAPESEKTNLYRPATMWDTRQSGEDKFKHFAKWGNRKAHRSDNSGLVQGLKLFQKNNPDVWVEYKHTAISGATIGPGAEEEENSQGMVDWFTGGREIFYDTSLAVNAARAAINGDIDFLLIPKSVIQMEPQLTMVERWISGQKIGFADLVLLSAGGNDAGFGKTIINAITGSLTRDFDGALESFQDHIGSTDEFATEMFNSFDELTFPRDRSGHVLWSNYPNLTQNEREQHSGLKFLSETLWIGGEITAYTTVGSLGVLLGAALAPVGGLALSSEAILATEVALAARNLNPAVLGFSLAIGSDDMENAAELLTGELNPAIQRWCDDHNQRSTSEIASECSVVDIQDRAKANGLPAREELRWFNTFIDSTREVCGGMDCSIHPNKKGFKAIYAEPFATRIAGVYANILKDEESNPVDLDNLYIATKDEINRRQEERADRVSRIRDKLPRIKSLEEVLKRDNPDSSIPQEKIDTIVAYLAKVDPYSVTTFLEQLKKQ